MREKVYEGALRDLAFSHIGLELLILNRLYHSYTILLAVTMADTVNSKPDSFHDEGLGQKEPSIKLAKAQTDDHPIEDEQFKQTSRRIVRKLDFTLIPIIWLLYLFNYLDRTAIA